MLYYILVILSVFAAACAQMLLKQGARKEHTSWWRQYINPWVIGGYGIMACSLVLNIWCMSKGVQVKEVSVIESMSYLFVPVLAFMLFKEKLTARKVCAIAIIIAGVILFFV
jgi:drug/metabolite transporter (DMT)-like permease